MASKVFVFAFLCVALVAVAQCAPQYSEGEEPTYDEEDFEVVPSKAQPASNDGQAASEDDFDPNHLVEHFNNARDAGRNPDFLKNPSSHSGDQSSASSSNLDE